MTLQEERAALQKRMDEIDAEIAGFVPGWYEYLDEEHCGRLQYMESIGLYNEYKSCYQHVAPFHAVAHKFLPEGWKVVGPDKSLE